MRTQVMLEVVSGLCQIGAAIIITLLQRWLLELSTLEKDVKWLKRQEIWYAWTRAKWYRGMEMYHQWKAWRILREFSVT